MPSITITTTTGPRWGDSSFNSSTAALKVGKSGTATYYGYVGFPALNPAWAIKSITFKMNRTDSYSTHVLQFGSSTSNAWGSKGTQGWKADFSVASGTGTKSWSLTAYKDILQGYTGTWYLHVQHGSGSNSYTEFNGGTGSTSPRLVVEYEDSSLTIPGDQLNIGVQSNITVGNLNSGLTHKVSFSIGSASGALASGGFITAGSVVNWTPDAALANQITDDMVGDITFTLENYSGGVFQSSRALTFPLNVPASYVPTISSAPLALQNPAGDTIGVYVQNRSWAKCTITASSVYGASIVDYRLTLGGVTYTSASNVITTGVLAQYGVLSGTVTVVDSRGQTATFTNASAATVYEYFAPIVTAFSLLRCDAAGVATNVGTYIKYVMSVIFASINNLNTKGGTVAFKVAGAQSYDTAVALSTISAYNTTVSGVIGGGAITSSGYVVQATLTDRYNSMPFEASLPSSKLWFDLHSSGEGMAIGKAADTPSLFDVGIASRFRDAAQFDVAPVIAASEIGTLLSRIMPCCKLSAPVADTISFNSTYRAWVFDFGIVERNDGNAYGVLLGGSGNTRKMGFVIPAAGMYRVTFLFRGTNGGGATDCCLGVARFSAAWTPPAANYITRDALFADANLKQSSLHYSNRLSTSSGDNLSAIEVYEFPADAGDKIWPWIALLTTTKVIVPGDTWASIQRVG